MEKHNAGSKAHTAPDFAFEHGALENLYTENGMYFTHLQHAGQAYRLGTTTPRFIQELSSMPLRPSQEDFDALKEKGLWLIPDASAPKVAVTCGGVGSVWPGMGRALYDTFPAAREAMDRLAAVASWDILGLMDEQSVEKIQCTRWQMPYLFFVEYAQAAYLQSLGFAPCLMSGHSLGELISLCLAGVYTPEVAWQIFDRRAVYIDGLEREAKDGMGMMAVYAGQEKIQALLELFPDLHICNHNTPTQFMLGGKKEMLAEARRALRKEKCPAITLPINMAFHHPHLRVLRQSAVDGLMGLPTQTPTIPILSNVTAGLYPTDKEGIVQYIADLDENTVRWVDCVRTMWDTFDIRHFVEFGSADNICGLVKDIEPRAVCIPVSLKNAEVKTMRAAVAHLYALGHIPHGSLHQVPASSFEEHAAPAHVCARVEQDVAVAEPEVHIPSYVQDILPILAEAAEVEVGILRPSMDLRHQLALRSNRFPAIMHKVEQQFGITLRLEDVMQVATIQDFAVVVARLRHPEQDFTPQDMPAAPCLADEGKSLSEPLYCLRGSLSPERTALQWQRMAWPSTLPFSSSLSAVRAKTQHILVLYAGQEQTLYTALDELAPFQVHFIFYVPKVKYAQCPQQEVLQRLERLGASVEICHDSNALSAVDSLVHFVEAPMLQDAADPVALPLLRSLEQSAVKVPAVLMMVTDNERGQGSAFVTEPVIAAMRSFWHTFGQKQKMQPKVRILRIPPVQPSSREEQNLSTHVYEHELAHYFARWYWCADVAQGRWLRQSAYEASEKNTDTYIKGAESCMVMQENVQVHPHMHALACEMVVEQGQVCELFTLERHFSAYAKTWPQKEQSQAEMSQRVMPMSTLLLLQSLYQANAFAFAWLTCLGGDGFVCTPKEASPVSEGPEGVTREGLIHVQGHPWRHEDALAVKPCDSELSLRGLSANGRRQDRWDGVAQGHLLLTASHFAPSALWTRNESQGTESVQVRKAFANANALSYAWVSELLELICSAALTGQEDAHLYVLQSAARVRHMSMPFISDASTVAQEGFTVQWKHHGTVAEHCTLDGQVLDAQGKILLTVQDMVLIK